MSTVLLVSAEAATGGWKEVLEESGVDVLTAHGFPDGVQRVREGGIDLIVVDAQSDTAPVEAFVGELHRLPDPPPFLLTSSSPNAPELSARLGAVGFLAKPYSAGELAEVVERVIPGTVIDYMDDPPTEPNYKLNSR